MAGGERLGVERRGGGVQHEGGTLDREDRAGARGGREQQGALLTHRWFSVWTVRVRRRAERPRHATTTDDGPAFNPDRTRRRGRGNSCTAGRVVGAWACEGGRMEEELVALLPRLRRFARALCRDDAEADDLVQAACERALARRDRFLPGTRLDSWLYRIMQNLWLDRGRTPQARREHLDIELGGRPPGRRRAGRDRGAGPAGAGARAGGRPAGGPAARARPGVGRGALLPRGGGAARRADRDRDEPPRPRPPPPASTCWARRPRGRPPARRRFPPTVDRHDAQARRRDPDGLRRRRARARGGRRGPGGRRLRPGAAADVDRFRESARLVRAAFDDTLAEPVPPTLERRVRAAARAAEAERHALDALVRRRGRRPLALAASVALLLGLGIGSRLGPAAGDDGAPGPRRGPGRHRLRRAGVAAGRRHPDAARHLPRPRRPLVPAVRARRGRPHGRGRRLPRRRGRVAARLPRPGRRARPARATPRPARSPRSPTASPTGCAPATRSPTSGSAT